MKPFQIAISAVAAACSAVSAVSAAAPLTPGKTVLVPGGPGGFDFMSVDASRHRLMATHPGKNELLVFNLKSGKLSKLDAGCEVNGEAVDEADQLLFTAGGGKKLVVLNLKSLKKVAEIALDGPADDIEFDPKNGVLYVDHDDSTEVWTVNPKTMKVTGTITVAGAPEVLKFDPTSNKIYQNIKPANVTQVINPETNLVEASWPTAPMTSPHGLALDMATHHLFAAGQGKLVEFDVTTGKVIDSKDIAPGYVDQIAFDSDLKRIYCASSVGTITVLHETDSGVELLGMVPVAKGTHTLAVDPNTHSVWISVKDATTSFLQEYLPAKEVADAR